MIERMCDKMAASDRGAGDSGALFPVAYSLLAPEALLADVVRSYSVGPLVDCALVRSYVNDVYVLRTTAERYILKVYRAGWRSWSEIAYELDVLNHLTARAVAVAPPLLRRDGRLIGTLAAPEGSRYTVLFPYARGVKPVRRPFTPELYYHFGLATARMYTALDDFTSVHARVPLDTAYLIDRPVGDLRPWLAHRPDDWRFLLDLAGKVRARILSLAEQGLDWGVCHGDLSLDNLHLTEDTAIIFYDFDSGGPGWRACDPYGVFQYGARDGLWDAFLQGYTEVRAFSAADRAAVPYFVAAYHIWSMGNRVRNWTNWSGLWRVDGEYFDERFAWLRHWNTEQLDRS